MSSNILHRTPPRPTSNSMQNIHHNKKTPPKPGSKAMAVAPQVPTGDIPKLSEDDIVISVMGVTGSGKSSFINYFSDEAEVGYGLESKTQNVQILQCQLEDGTKFYLVDTPGFDDTHRSESDVLSTIADWLSEAYQNRINLTGIIYLHRILDPRIGGAAMKNLKMFKRLVGDKGLGSVALATTMWENVPPQTGNLREADLKNRDDFWKYMLSQGAQIFRQNRGRDSAIEIVKYLINRRRPIITNLQRELVDQNLKLNETAAGREVVSDYDQLKAQLAEKLASLRGEFEKAAAQQNQEMMDELKELQAEYQQRTAEQEAEIEKLRVDRQELRRLKEEQYAKEIADVKAQIESASANYDKTQAELQAYKAKAAEYKARYWQLKWATRCVVM